MAKATGSVTRHCGESRRDAAVAVGMMGAAVGTEVRMDMVKDGVVAAGAAGAAGAAAGGEECRRGSGSNAVSWWLECIIFRYLFF